MIRTNSPFHTLPNGLISARTSYYHIGTGSLCNAYNQAKACSLCHTKHVVPPTFTLHTTTMMHQLKRFRKRHPMINLTCDYRHLGIEWLLPVLFIYAHRILRLVVSSSRASDRMPAYREGHEGGLAAKARYHALIFFVSFAILFGQKALFYGDFKHCP